MSSAFLLLVFSNFLGGSSYLATVYTLRGFSVLDSVFWRMLVSTALMAPWLLRLRGSRVAPRDWLRMAGVGVFGYAAPLLIGTFGLARTTATHGVLLAGVEPVAIVVLAALFLKEPLTRLKIGAMALGLAGAALIVTQGSAALAPSDVPRAWGDILLATTGILWALYTILGKPTLRRVDPLAFTAATNLIALLLVAAAAAPALTRPAATDRLAWAAMGYLALVNVLGPWSWNKALEKIPASQTANFVFIQPLVGVLLGVFLGQEKLTLMSGAGGGLILLGVYAASRE